MPLLSRLRDMFVSASPFAVWLLLTASVVTQQPAPAFTDQRYPGAEAPAGEKWITIRVVDRISGEPIPAAELLLLGEAAAPVTGAAMNAWRFEADDEGFLAARVDEGAEGFRPWGWLCVRAAGYCQHMRHQHLSGSVIRLSPSVAVPVQVRDWRDRPVAGATVGFCAGCGHTPDLVWGVTGEQGVVMLPGVDLLQGIADFYVVHPELELGYSSGSWYPGGHPMMLRVSPGTVHRGKVVDHSGRPVAAAAVGISTVHRGPWTKTRADGSFELSGLGFEGDLRVLEGGRKVIFAGDGTEGLHLALPKPDGTPTVVVELSDDVLQRREREQEQREALAELRQAAWPKVLVRVVGMPIPTHGKRAEKQHASKKQECGVLLHTRGGRYDITDRVLRGERVGLPAEDFVFELWLDDEQRILSCNREEAVREGVIRLPWFRPTRLEGQIVSEQGDSSPAEVELRELCADLEGESVQKLATEGGLMMPTERVGHHWLVVESGGALRILPVELPPRGDDVAVDVGTIIVPDESPLKVLQPGGEPFAAGKIEWLRVGFPAVGLSPDEHGQVWAPDLQPGDCVRVLSRRAPPADLGKARLVDVASRFVVEKGVPCTFRQHGGELLLDIDAGDTDTVVGVTVGEHAVQASGPVLVRGLAVGTHQVFVSAAGRQSAMLNVEVGGAGEARAKVALALPAVK